MLPYSLRLVWAIAVLLEGCTSVRVTPELPALTNPIPLVQGRIEYRGNLNYLPRTVAQTPPTSEPALTLRYETTETQQPSGWDVIALFNPLSIIGFPTGNRASTVMATLEILQNGNLLQSYTATSQQEAIRGIYYGSSFSELRREGLLAVRNSIEAQMARNRPSFSTAPQTPAAFADIPQPKEEP